ncbi:hypothetical protein Tco_0537063 [Tanacetum coccineum]
MSNTNNNLQTQTSSVLHNDTVSSCSTSKVQEKTQLSRSKCMHSLREVKSQFKFLSETLQDFGTVPIFKRTFSQNLDLLEQHLTKDILSQTDCNTTLTKLRTTFENAFNSEFKEHKYFVEYTGIEVKRFRDILLQHMGNVKKFVAEEHVIKDKSSGTELEVQDESSRSGNDTDADDADLRPIYDEEPMAKYPEKCQVKSPMLDSSPDNQTTEYSKQYLESENILLKKTVAQIQKDFSRMEAHKFFDSCTRKVYSEPPHGSNVDIPNIYECKQTLDVSAGKSQSMVAEKADISETIVKVDSQIMIQKNDLESLFGPMFDELLNGSTQVMSKYSAVSAADATNKRQQQNTTSSTSITVTADIPPLNIQTTPKTSSQAPTQAPTVTSTENIIQAETNKEYAQVEEDEFYQHIFQYHP